MLLELFDWVAAEDSLPGGGGDSLLLGAAEKDEEGAGACIDFD